MSPPADRLQKTLGQPELVRLLDALQQRLSLGRPLTGRLTLAAATSAEREAVDLLLGRNTSRGDSLQIDLDFFAETLAAAGLSTSLRAAVEALRGPVSDRRVEAGSLAAAWAAVRAQAAAQFSSRPELTAWLDDLFTSGLLKRLAYADSVRAAALLADVSNTVRALPVRADPLATLAARLFGDAHALDPGRPCATLAVRAAALIGGIPFEDDGEGRRAAWASVGVMCDELSAPALVLNLPSASDTPLGRLLRSAAGDAEPLHVSLRLLLRHSLARDPALAGTDVYLCENSTIVAHAAIALGHTCASLICFNGQFATPSLILLRQLRAAGARLHYHGDFDPGGVAIARRVFAESGAAPWRYAAADYLAAPKGRKFSGKIAATPWSPSLAAEMELAGHVVHEEAVFAELAQDLVRINRAEEPGGSGPLTNA